MKVHYLANSWGEGSSWEEWSDDLRLPKNFGMKEKLSGWRISQEFLFCSLWFVWLWSHVLIIKQVFSVILVVTIPSSDVFEVWVVWPWPWLNYIKLFCRESSRKKHLCSEKMGSTQARNNMNFMVLLSGNMFLLSEIHLCLAILLCRLPLSGWLSAYRFIWVLKISEQPNDSDPCKSFFLHFSFRPFQLLCLGRNKPSSILLHLYQRSFWLAISLQQLIPFSCLNFLI